MYMTCLMLLGIPKVVNKRLCRQPMYFMINDQDAHGKTELIEFHGTPTLDRTRSSSYGAQPHRNDTNQKNQSHFKVSLRSPRTRQQKKQMTLEEWYKLPEYVRTRIPCPVLLKDTVTHSPITKKIKEAVYDRTLYSSAGDLNDTKDILPSSRFVCKKKHTASKDITPSPPKPRWRYVSKSSMSKASTKADIKLLNLLSPRKIQ